MCVRKRERMCAGVESACASERVRACVCVCVAYRWKRECVRERERESKGKREGVAYVYERVF